MAFINEDFMLKNKTGKRLFYEFAKDMPIIDYHCHLVPAQIADNHRFADVAELMLGGDHYKWRAMRSAGVDEAYITGKESSGWEKFQKWAEVMPLLIGNPLYHWTHLELKRYFDIDETLCPETAERIFKICNEKLQEDSFCARELIKNSGVEVLCTTDDPMDDLAAHKLLRDSFSVRVLPTFRPDKAVNIDRDTFVPYMKALGAVSVAGLKQILSEKIAYFHSMGCRLSDHALDTVPYAEGDAEAAFAKAMKGEPLTRAEIDAYKTEVLLFCGAEYARLDWVMQLHIGALRNNNSRMYKALGPDVGFDSINDDVWVAQPLSRLMDALDSKEQLPKTILYTLHPKDNYVLGTMLGNFQRAPYFGKIQFGSGWWFNDQRDGMEAQMRALANLGVFSSFVGMLTDSRSLISYPRHEYFRRILCNLIGSWVENGEYPEDWNALERIVKGICYENAKGYFNF